MYEFKETGKNPARIGITDGIAKRLLMFIYKNLNYLKTSIELNPLPLSPL